MGNKFLAGMMHLDSYYVISIKIVFVVLLTTNLVSCSTQGTHVKEDKRQSGKVINPKTGLPISGAQITVTCSQLKFIHGTKKIKELTIKSNKNGVFGINMDDYSECRFLDFQVKKTGMFEVREVVREYFFSTSPEFRSVPKRMFMLPNNEKTKLMESGTIE